MRKAAGPLLALSALVVPAPTLAQDAQLEWSQTLNLSKGLNMPSGVSADILGIQLGDSYAEARAKLEAMLPPQEAKPKSEQPASQSLGVNILSMQMQSMDSAAGLNAAPAVKEIESVFRLQVPGANRIVSASYISQLQVERAVDGASGQKIPETIIVTFSAPSSGHQVIGVYRSVRYGNAERDQPHMADLQESVSAKFAATPRRYQVAAPVQLLYQFDNGTAVDRPDLPENYCIARAWDDAGGVSEEHIPNMNRTGDCDVALGVEMRPGISTEHVGTVVFRLSGNERARQNYTADFAFFRSYIQNLQSGGGATPKL